MGMSDGLIAGVYPLRRVKVVAVSAVAAMVVLFALSMMRKNPTWFGLSYAVASLTAAVSVVIWLWRARKNLDAFPEITCSFGAGWAIAGWLIPVANLVIPFRVMDDVIRGCMPKSRVARVVPLWWTALLLAQLIFLVATPGTVVALVAAVLYAVAGAGLSFLIMVVTRAQEAEIRRRRELMEIA